MLDRLYWSLPYWLRHTLWILDPRCKFGFHNMWEPISYCNCGFSHQDRYCKRCYSGYIEVEHNHTERLLGGELVDGRWVIKGDRGQKVELW